MSDPPPSFDDIFLPLTNTYSVNWPHRSDACFVRRTRRSRPRPSGGGDRAAGAGEAAAGGATPGLLREVKMFPDTGEEDGDDDMVLGLTPEFEAHVRDLSNWTLGPDFADAFPQWKDCVRIRN